MVKHKSIEYQTENLGIYLGLLAADARFFLTLDSRWGMIPRSDGYQFNGAGLNIYGMGNLAGIESPM